MERGGNVEDTGRDLGRQINHASVLFHRSFDNVVAAESAGYTDSLSGRNIWVLRYIRDHADEDVFQKDLESAFKIRRSTVSQTVELMEQKQLLVREPVNGDARLKRLRLTPKAEEVLEAVSRGVSRLENRVRTAFAPEDYGKLVRLLEQLCGILEAMPPESGQMKQGKE